MAYRRMRKRSYRRRPTYRRRSRYIRRYRRRNGYRTGSGGIVRVRAVSGLPNGFRVCLKYTDQFQVETGPADLRFRANSPFDPVVASGGAQPPMWDTYASMYAHYYCYASKLTVKIVAQSDHVFSCYTLLNRDSTDESLTPHATLSGYRNSRFNVVGPRGGGREAQKDFKLWFSVKKNADRKYYSYTDFTSAVTTNPVELYYFHVITQGLPIDPPVVEIYVKIKYYIIFTNKKMQTDS